MFVNVTRPDISQSVPQDPDFRKEFCPLQAFFFLKKIYEYK